MTIPDRVLDILIQQLDYRALPGRSSVYGQAVGYPNQPWNGSFLAYVFREAGIDVPDFTSTVTALSHYVRENRIYRNPKIGDIAFFENTTDPFGQPRVGVVTKVARWKSENAFSTIEGEVGSPYPKGNTDPTGVYEITHYGTDVIGFARPQYKNSVSPKPQTGNTVRVSTVQPGRKNAQVTDVQHALFVTVGARDMEAGKFDRQTRSAYARWQRLCGRVGKDADGTPELDSLTRLAERVGTFTAKD